MAIFEEHCRESLRFFGNEYKAVHRWLDEYAGVEGIGMRHRKYRHHLAGIEELVAIMGENVREVAIRHVMTDLKEEGWIEGKDPFPKDKEDYIKMGLF